MVTIFNRRELTLTYSLKEQAEIRQALAGAGLDYHVRMVDAASRGAPSRDRARMGACGVDKDAAIEYIFYVRRKDYEAACASVGICNLG